MSDTVTIRLSTSDDHQAILILGELDCRKVPLGAMLLAIENGELRAALPLGGGEAIADPFHPTAVLVDLLRVRKALLHSPDASRNRARRARLAHAWRALLGSDVSGSGWGPRPPHLQAVQLKPCARATRAKSERVLFGGWSFRGGCLGLGRWC